MRRRRRVMVVVDLVVLMCVGASAAVAIGLNVYPRGEPAKEVVRDGVDRPTAYAYRDARRLLDRLFAERGTLEGIDAGAVQALDPTRTYTDGPSSGPDVVSVAVLGPDEYRVAVLSGPEADHDEYPSSRSGHCLVVRDTPDRRSWENDYRPPGPDGCRADGGL